MLVTVAFNFDNINTNNSLFYLSVFPFVPDEERILNSENIHVLLVNTGENNLTFTQVKLQSTASFLIKIW